MLDVLDATAVRQWCRSAVDLVDAHAAELDALNVFPVPDGDTGHNLLATLRAAWAALDADKPDDPAGALARLAEGAASGAQGNSGFIASQVLRGLAEAAAGMVLDGRWLAAGLAAGARFARSAVMAPVEGTILTVAQEAAAAADHTAGTLGQVALAAATAADSALLRTTAQLPELTRAGVVDAGGRGLVLLLDALVRTVTGAPAPLTPVSATFDRPAVATPTRRSEVQYGLVADEAVIARLRAAIAAIGDSVAVVPTAPGAWKVHVHVDAADVGAALEAGLDAGRPSDITITELTAAGRTGAAQLLVVDPGAGLAPLFEAEGVRVITAAETGAALVAMGDQAQAVVLTDVADEVAEAVAQARERGARVSVVPTRSPVQMLAAVSAHDPGAAFDDDVVTMAEAAAATRWARLSIAPDRALTAVGMCEPGDVLGMIDGEVVEVGRGLLAVAFAVVDRLLGVGAELITVLVADGTPHRTGELIEAHVRGRSPLTDVGCYPGGASPFPVVIGAE